MQYLMPHVALWCPAQPARLLLAHGVCSSHCGSPQGPLMHAQQVRAARNPGYSPDFTGAVQHFCVHPGARMIIDKVSEVRPARAMM